MTLYAIIFTACLAAEPCVVKEQYVNLSPMPSTAYVQAQALVASWLNEHPGWRVPAWRLEPGRGA